MDRRFLLFLSLLMTIGCDFAERDKRVAAFWAHQKAQIAECKAAGGFAATRLGEVLIETGPGIPNQIDYGLQFEACTFPSPTSSSPVEAR